MLQLSTWTEPGGRGCHGGGIDTIVKNAGTLKTPPLIHNTQLGCTSRAIIATTAGGVVCQTLTNLPSGSASSRSSPPGVSLVMNTQANSSKHNSTGALSTCKNSQLTVAEGLACPSDPAQYNRTSPVAQALLVQHNSLPFQVASNNNNGTDSVIGSRTLHSLASGTAGPERLADAPTSVQPLLKGSWPLYSLERWPHAVSMSALQRRHKANGSTGASKPENIDLRMQDEVILILAPPVIPRLLRSERLVIRSEVVVIKWIKNMLFSTNLAQAANQYHHHDVLATCVRARGRNQIYFSDKITEGVDLLKYLPVTKDHTPWTNDLDISTTYLHARFSHLSHSLSSKRLTALERSDIDYQVGGLVRCMSQFQSPMGTFGPAIAVLNTTCQVSKAVGSSGKVSRVSKSWRLAFHIMLEAILRDAEDMAVTIPYKPIRRHFHRFTHCLDAVSTPRLVIVDAGHDWNVIAERVGADQRTERKQERATNELADFADKETNVELTGTAVLTVRERIRKVKVTGLRDWSNCIFGDPLLALASTDRTCRDLVYGFSGLPQRRTSHGAMGEETLGWASIYSDEIECPGNAHIRLLLYQCYHCTVSVVKEFYRPRRDSSSRELVARKRLNMVLERLEDIKDHPKKGHIRPTCEMSPAKRPKTDHEDQGGSNRHGTG